MKSTVTYYPVKMVVICLFLLLFIHNTLCSEAFQRLPSHQALPVVTTRASASVKSIPISPKFIALKEKERWTVALLTKNLHKLTHAVDPTLFGGLLAGGLHAITGPDHLAAIIPNSMGKTGFYGAQLGAIWGLGHGVSACLLGFAAFFLKGKISGKFHFLDKLSSVAEVAVGLSLVGIGALGIIESREGTEEESHSHSSSQQQQQQLPVKTSRIGTAGAVFANGLLHGFSWDGAPSLAPAIAMSSWRAASIFLGAYSLGTVIAMSLSAGFISALSSKLGQLSNQPDLPKKLSLFSSMFAVAIGIYWLFQSFFLK